MTNYEDDPRWNVAPIYHSYEGIALDNGWKATGATGGPLCLEYWRDEEEQGHVQLVVKNQNFGPYQFSAAGREDKLYEMVSTHSSVFIGFSTGPYLPATVYVDEKWHPYFQKNRNPTGFFHRSIQVSIPKVNHISIPTRPRP